MCACTAATVLATYRKMDATLGSHSSFSAQYSEFVSETKQGDRKGMPKKEKMAFIFFLLRDMGVLVEIWSSPYCKVLSK